LRRNLAFFTGVDAPDIFNTDDKYPADADVAGVQRVFSISMTCLTDTTLTAIFTWILGISVISKGAPSQYPSLPFCLPRSVLSHLGSLSGLEKASIIAGTHAR
jgi:hypothetical protein